MKQLLRVIAYTLALNFLALAGGAGYLWKTHHLDRAKIKAIKLIVFPPPAPPVMMATSVPATQPVFSLDDLLKKAAGLSAGDQVQFLQHAFDSRMAQLDLRQRELSDQQQLIDFGRGNLERDRATLDSEKKTLAAQQQQAAQQASDQGFQDTLALYVAMPAPKAKDIFMNLSEETVRRYLEAMDARTAAKIIKEFKSPDEMNRIQKVLERMREPATLPASAAASLP